VPLRVQQNHASSIRLIDGGYKVPQASL
jgi:hypothetical protein